MTDDRALVSRVLDGDEQALRQLISAHERLVAHMVGRIVRQEQDLEELCQDVFLRVIDKLSEFNFQSRLSTWIATIAYRHAINHLRKQKMDFQSLPDGEEWREQFIEREDPGALAEDRDLEDKTLKLIEELPVQYKAVLTLYHLDGMNYAEISMALGMPEGTVKSYLFRARNTLKEKVKRYLGDEII